MREWRLRTTVGVTVVNLVSITSRLYRLCELTSGIHHRALTVPSFDQPRGAKGNSDAAQDTQTRVPED